MSKDNYYGKYIPHHYHLLESHKLIIKELGSRSGFATVPILKSVRCASLRNFDRYLVRIERILREVQDVLYKFMHLVAKKNPVKKSAINYNEYSQFINKRKIKQECGVYLQIAMSIKDVWRNISLNGIINSPIDYFNENELNFDMWTNKANIDPMIGKNIQKYLIYLNENLIEARERARYFKAQAAVCDFIEVWLLETGELPTHTDVEQGTDIIGIIWKKDDGVQIVTLRFIVHHFRTLMLEGRKPRHFQNDVCSHVAQELYDRGRDSRLVVPNAILKRVVRAIEVLNQGIGTEKLPPNLDVDTWWSEEHLDRVQGRVDDWLNRRLCSLKD